MFHILYGGTYHKKNGTVVVRRDLISSNTKKRHYPRKENRGEVGIYGFKKKGDVP